MKSVAVIINPVAGKGRGKRTGDWLVRRLREKGFETEVHFSCAPGETTHAARETTRQIVVAVGGDGTINEVVHGMADSPKSLAIIPAGSGNDLIRSLGIPSQPEQALDRLLYGAERLIDLGTIVCDRAPEVRFFVNGAGIGFDAAVALKTKEIGLLRGLPLYVVAVLRTLGEYRAPEFSIRIDKEMSRGRKLLIAIGNGSSAGGGFLLTPNARVDDGILDVCMIDDLSIMQVISIMPKAIKGDHIRSDRVQTGNGREIEISADDPFVVHTDGEVIGVNCRHALINVRKHALRVFA